VLEGKVPELILVKRKFGPRRRDDDFFQCYFPADQESKRGWMRKERKLKTNSLKRIKKTIAI